MQEVIPPPPEFPADPWQAFLDYMAATEGQDPQIKMGQEGQIIERGMHKGKGIAVFTSGGDSQVRILLFLAASWPFVFSGQLFIIYVKSVGSK